MPLISVVMSTYNRADMIKDSIESVLNQTFDDYEFIIVNDGSDDGTDEIINEYKDKRIRLIKNRRNLGCTFNYHYAHRLSKGKYIAHIDDDDISYPERLKKQYEYLEANQQIALAGTYIETFGENKRPSWVMYKEPEELDFLMNIYNPMCHSSIMYRKEFLDNNQINYDFEKKCSQDYDLYKQIIMKGGKLSNIDEILVKYKMHPKRITDIKETMQIQIKNADIVKKELLMRFLSEKEYTEATELLTDFPFNDYKKENAVKAINIIKERNTKYSAEMIDKITEDIRNNKFKF